MDELIYRKGRVYALPGTNLAKVERDDDATISDAYFFEYHGGKAVRQETMTPDSGLMLVIEDAAGLENVPIKCLHTIGKLMADLQFNGNPSQIRGTSVRAYTSGDAIVGIMPQKPKEQIPTADEFILGKKGR